MSPVGKHFSEVARDTLGYNLPLREEIVFRNTVLSFQRCGHFTESGTCYRKVDIGGMQFEMKIVLVRILACYCEIVFTKLACFPAG
jgi:hypothetical protein